MRALTALFAVSLCGALLTAGQLSDSVGSASPLKARALCLAKRATIVGSAKADTLHGTAHADVIAGLGGNDTIDGRAGNDVLCGGPGSDLVRGSAGVDRLDGGAGSDRCRLGERLVGCEDSRRPLEVGLLAPGEYVTDVFRPRFSITLGSGWRGKSIAPEKIIDLYRTDGSGVMFIGTNLPGATVDGRMAQLSSVPALKPSTPVATTIGGRPGRRIDLSNVDGTTSMPVPGEEKVSFDPGQQGRIYVTDVGGRIVVFSIIGREQFVPLLAISESVLETLRWG